MSKITIRRGDNTQIAPHFKASEFFSNSSNAPASHDFYSELVEAVEFLRTHYGVAWRITSTYRPESAGSQHNLCRAVDSQDAASGAGNPSPVILALVSELLNPRSEVFRTLRRIGITGFGVYDTFVHLDCRDISRFPAAHSDKYGSFAFWDNRKKKLPASTVLVPQKNTTPSSATSLGKLPGKSLPV